MKIYKYFLMIFYILLFSSCGNNLHYTGALNSLNVNLNLPATTTVGQSISISGTCFPNGTGNINIVSNPAGDFSPSPMTCDCTAGLLTNCRDSLLTPVLNIVFSGTGPGGKTPQIVSTVTDPSNGQILNQNSNLTIIPLIDLTGPLAGSAGGTAAPFSPIGTCSFAGPSAAANVTIIDVSNSMSPSTINCNCNGPGVGVLDCSSAPNVIFSSENPNLNVTINDGLTTGTDTTPITINVNPIIDLATPAGGPFNLGETVPLIGTCDSLNDTVSIPNPSPSNFSPAGPRVCSCGVPILGQFNCGSYTVTGSIATSIFVATITDADSQTDSNSEAVTIVSPNLSVTLSLSHINGMSVSVGAGAYANQVLRFTVVATNSGTGNASNVQLTDLCPSNTTSNGVFSPGTGTYSLGSGLWTVPSLSSGGGSDTLTFECLVNTGLGTGTITNNIASISSTQTGSVSLSGVNTTNPILSPSVDLSSGPLSPTPGASVSLPMNMGSCLPAGSPSSITVTNANSSMSPSTVTCDCNSAGQINCGSNNVTFTSTDASLVASISANGVGPIADSNSLNDPTVVVTPTLTLTDPNLGPYSAGASINMVGACQSPGSSITVTPSPSMDLTPASRTCACNPGGTFSCSSFTVNGAGTNSTITFTAVITDQDPTAPETANATMQEDIAFGVMPVATLTPIIPNVDATLACVGVPNGFNNTASTYDPACNTSALRNVRYRVFLRLNGGSQNLIASYPTPTTFSDETATFTASGATGTYNSVTVSNWNLFAGVTLDYNDEICVSNIVRNCAAGGDLTSTESTQSCFKWFGRQVFTSIGANQFISPPSGPAPTQIYAKLWGAAGGAGTADADVRKTQGGAGGYTSYRGAYDANHLIVVGRGGNGGVINSGGAATYGGGGSGGNGQVGRGGAGSGGGLSGIFLNAFTQVNSVAIAGGGGGGGVGTGSALTGNGGSGGGSAGGSGSFQNNATNGGKGGTQLAGGATTTPGPGTAGSALQGGNGASGGQGSGGGGGGYFGGGGGGVAAGGFNDQGGGGGSGFLLGGAGTCKTLSTLGATSTTYSPAGTAGTSPSNITDPDYITNVGVSRYATAGGNGLMVIYYIP